jgi:hypothetical protein
MSQGWENVKVAEIAETTGGYAPLPAGEHTFKLLGAKMDKYRPDNLALDLVIDEGAGKGRRVFPTLPPPANNEAWPAQAIAKLGGVLGVQAQPGETPVDFLNRVAANGNARFKATTGIKEYTKRDGTTGSDVAFQWFSILPVAGSVGA